MLNKNELNLITITSKESLKEEIFVPLLEEINDRMIFRAKKGFTFIDNFICDLLHTGHVSKSNWGALSPKDYAIFIHEYYTFLGYEVTRINFHDGNYGIRIDWAD